MNDGALLALAGIVAAVGVNVGGWLIAWGALKGAVAALAGRVAALEADAKGMEALKLDVARLEVRLDAVVEQLKDLNAQIRWLRQPGPGRASRTAAPAVSRD